MFFFNFDQCYKISVFLTNMEKGFGSHTPFPLFMKKLTAIVLLNFSVTSVTPLWPFLSLSLCSYFPLRGRCFLPPIDQVSFFPTPHICKLGLKATALYFRYV